MDHSAQRTGRPADRALGAVVERVVGVQRVLVEAEAAARARVELASARPGLKIRNPDGVVV